MKRPAYPIYTETWFADSFVRNLSLPDRAVYMELLLLSWQEDGISEEMVEDHAAMARFLGRGVGPRIFAATWARLRGKFVLSAGRWRNKRVEKERAKARQWRAKFGKNAESGAQGSLLGSPSVSVSVSTSRSPTEISAQLLLSELNQARMMNIEGCRHLAPVEANLKHITACLEAGASEDDIRHVIAVCAAEVREKPEAAQWFNAVTPFRPDNFQRKLAMPLRKLGQSKPAPALPAYRDAREVMRLERENAARISAETARRMAEEDDQ